LDFRFENIPSGNPGGKTNFVITNTNNGKYKDNENAVLKTTTFQ
jgi:hypothetical protein